MKRAPLKILLVIFITGMICVFGTLVLSRELTNFQNIYHDVMDEYVANREYMAEIEVLLYEHQSLIANHVLSDGEQESVIYEEEEESLETKITQLIVDFSERMKGGDREKLYHKVYSDYAGYISNVDVLLSYKMNGEENMAIYYNDHILKPYLDDINVNLSNLDAMIEDEIKRAEDKMQEANALSRVLTFTSIVIIVVALLICTYVCIRITYDLDRYKINLEKEVLEKNEKIIRIQDNVIISMANLIESRDGETGEHVKRTSVYVGMIAKAAREKGYYLDILTDEYIERLVKVAPLHDVGKIVVPDYILMKSGKLTEEEFEKIRKHAPEGSRVIKEFFVNLDDKEYVKMASDVAGYHHEKWDGSGYTEKLSGEDIPLSARIMAIADVFDALVSKRRYKDAFSYEQAFSIIQEESGSHFDPKLTEAFLSVREQVEAYLSDGCPM